jgi:hypothetical protein
MPVKHELNFTVDGIKSSLLKNADTSNKTAFYSFASYQEKEKIPTCFKPFLFSLIK